MPALYAALAQSAVETARHQLAQRGLTVNHTQAVTLGVMAAYVVVIALLWNLPYVRWVLWPFKMLVIAFHEFGHAITACCGVTQMQGGMSAITLLLGTWGRRSSGPTDFRWIRYRRQQDSQHYPWGLFSAHSVVGTEGLVDHTDCSSCGRVVGGMLCDDLILRKVNSSDASVFAKRYGGSSQCWGVIWSLISLAFMAIGIIGGIAAFPQSFSQQQSDSKNFISTR
ncbi:hypothetical protein PDIDSM_43 [Penicillium digitatum]|nr:hypothetical protein PDIDSM_43 [Penicillium digitatum]